MHWPGLPTFERLLLELLLTLERLLLERLRLPTFERRATFVLLDLCLLFETLVLLTIFIIYIYILILKYFYFH